MSFGGVSGGVWPGLFWHALALPGLETGVIFGIKLRAASYMFKICWRGWRPRLPPSLAGVWIYLKAAWHEATGHFYCGTWGNMRAPLASAGAVSLLAHVHVRAARRHIKGGKAQERLCVLIFLVVQVRVHAPNCTAPAGRLIARSCA